MEIFLMPEKTTEPLPILFDDQRTQQVRYMRRRFPGFGRADLQNLKNFPVINDNELLLHYLQGVAGPFIDFLVLIDIGCGFELIPTDFENDDDGQEAKKVVEKEFEKMDLELTMNRHACFGEILGKRSNVRTYNSAGGFYYDKKAGINGIDAINPMTWDMTSVEKVRYDRTGTIPYIQKVSSPYIQETEVKIEADRVDYNVRGGILKQGVHGISALANCLMDLRTGASAPALRLELMYKQSNVYKHTHLDVAELLKTDAGKDLLSDWEKMEKKLEEQSDMLRRQEEERKGIISYSFMKPAEIVSMSGKATDFAETEKNTYDVIAMKTGVPLALIFSDAAKTINRSSMEQIIGGVVRERESNGNGGRKEYRTLITSYAQEIKSMEGINEGYFKLKFKPFLAQDLEAILNRMIKLREVGAASKTELRRSQDMADEIDFGAKGESADYQEIPSDTLIENPNPHLEPENSVEKKQRLVELKKSFRQMGVLS